MGKCYNSTIVDSPIDEVWNTVKNFHDMSWAQDVITDVKVVGDKGGTDVGAKRILNDAFHETLISIDDDSYTFTYSIDDGPGPVSNSSVSNYLGVVKLSSITDSGGTFVEWSSSYESPDDNAVDEFCNPIYVALLASLKSSLM